MNEFVKIILIMFFNAHFLKNAATIYNLRPEYYEETTIYIAFNCFRIYSLR